MNNYLWLLIVLVVLFVVYIAYIWITKGRKEALTKLRETTYALMLAVEKNCKDMDGEGKFEIVITKLYELLPDEIEFFISEQTFRDFVQNCYNKTKDYLDDGEINCSLENE